MGTILLIIALFIAALLLVAAEVCTPIFGLLTAAALACLGAMVYLCFTVSGVLGIVAVVALVFLMPLYLWAMVRYLPRTPLGRALQLGSSLKAPGEGTPDAAEDAALIGKTGMAETALRPSGSIRVGGRRIVATAEAGFIEKGAAVKIIRSSGMNVVVQKFQEPG